ncbi:hypothetical protein [Sinorhizobium meliloti]|uniref:hypothetical protein n=1 Tax=Rhizobium meliloti TaxID=382 RepID=UPI001AEC95BE|nr:hypothetical protein [Sinorhizobium meliloti]
MYRKWLSDGIVAVFFDPERQRATAGSVTALGTESPDRRAISENAVTSWPTADASQRR